ncbi:fungal peroxidase [Favolaschia claudopus]|uniref:Fungal peroxidase n=1 Tax=Favolaschia claudopus TaxID=2862362 RepID=A0AAW0E3C8_9AGAR
MRLHSFATVLSFSSLAVGLASAANLGRPPVLPKRKASILIDPAAQPDLPTIGEAKAAASAVNLNLTDVQADILLGMKKDKELFFFFSIADAKTFKAKLKTVVLPLVTSTDQIINRTTEPDTMLNIAFSQTGLTALNITDNLGDAPFAGGQLKDIGNLNDPGTTNWVPQFVGTSIHGVILLASSSVDNVNTELATLKTKLGSSIKEVYSLEAAARPGTQQGHEHFGYLDGISNPSVEGFQLTPFPGQAVVPTGEILVGESGDKVQRPAWAKDGSFLVFRQLEQLVPEFNKFLMDNPIRAPGLTARQGSDLLGARMIGRWKSGAPVFLSPLHDDPVLGGDNQRNNNFTYVEPGQTRTDLKDPASESKCPFSAHIRKTRPRADLGLPEGNSNDGSIKGSSNHHIVRGGIPYGPEVSSDEATSSKTKTERGLAFVAYQSNIGNGFQFLQKLWANNAGFVTGTTGFDPIIGANQGSARDVSGLDLTNLNRTITLTTDFVVSRGGEYFFSPSLSALSTKFSA